MLSVLCFGATVAPSALAAPANDDFAQAEELTGTSDTASGTNVDATSEPNEPENRNGVPPGATVWYRWTAPADLEVTVNTCGSGYDTVMAAFEGAALASLDRLDSDDDACAPGSQVQFDAEPGATYWIAIDGFFDGSSYAQGAIELELTTVAPPPPGPPETFYVRTGGTGADCTEADPCGAIANALAAHRVTSGPGDVIDVGPGDFPENVEAGDDFDGGLTIRGTLDANGDHLTSITGSGGGGASCPYACAVLLGASDDVAVTLQDVAVSTATADGYVGTIMVGGGSDLEGVHASVQPGAFTTAVVEFLDEDGGTVISDSTIDARDTFAVGLWGGNGVTVRDSQAYSDYQTVQQFSCGCASEQGLTIVRSHFDTTDDTQPVMNIDAGLTLDSALVTGGTGIFAQAYHGERWEINNSTIDAGEPGVADPGGVFSLSIGNYDGWEEVTVDVDSSILVEPTEAWGDGMGTVGCAFSDLPENDIGSSWVDDCQPGSNDNTTTDPADLFEDAAAGDWSLRADSPAIDAGQPGAIPAGFSATDIDGNPRRQPGTAASCPDGVRDQGAYEAAGVSCPRTLTVSTTGTGAGTVTGPGIDCGGPGHTDCTETVPDGTMVDLIATPAEGSRFDGFSGGGCSASPCTVTLDADTSVEAGFSEEPAPPPPPPPPPPIAQLEITGVELDRRAGTATLTVEATVAGSVAIVQTNNVEATDRIAVSAGGSAELEVKPRHRAARALRRRGRASVNPRALLYPDGGGQVGARARVNLRRDR